MAKRPIITLLTDFGLADHYVAAMKGVILGICPDAQLVDISHEIAAFRIEQAAFSLGQAYVCFPHGTTHLVVVDPGVGSARRPLLLEASGHSFVAPDNGVLSVAMENDPCYKAREISARRFFCNPVSNTFHGRDIFAPVAAHVACGMPPSDIGERIPDAVQLDFRHAVRLDDGSWSGRILHVDRFGNLVTNFRSKDVPEIAFRPFKMQVQEATVSQYFPTFEGAPELLPVAVSGSSGYIEVAVNRGDAAKITGATSGASVTLQFSLSPVL